MKLIRSVTVFILFSSAFFYHQNAFAANSARQGVYQYVVQECETNFVETSDLLALAISESNFQLVAKPDMAAPENCSFRSRVFIVYEPEYAANLLQINRLTAPFAIADRINLFEDEAGVHVSIVNPVNIIRTVLLDDKKYTAMAESHRQSLRSLITRAVKGKVSEKQYGQMRKKGKIGKTMGVMAGGPFNEKIKTIVEVNDGNFSDLLQRLEAALDDSGKWQMAHRFTLSFPDEEIAILGVSGAPMERKSFAIVKAGNDGSRKKFNCPGIAHAGAYPLEVVLTKEKGLFKVQIVEAMFRMKMYFEDAGKWAFMKNMTMPGSLAGELEKKIKSVVPGK